MVSLGIFSVVPPTEPCALRSTQPLKVSTRYFSWGKGGRCVWLTTYHPCSTETSRKSGALTYPEPLGPPRPIAGDLLPNIIWVLKSRKTIYAGRVVRIWWGGLRELEKLENLGVYGMIILKWILKNRDKWSKDWDYLAQDRNICWAQGRIKLFGAPRQ